MRKIMRNIARWNMKRLGFHHLNKRKNKKEEKVESVFSKNWRKYVHTK